MNKNKKQIESSHRSLFVFCFFVVLVAYVNYTVNMFFIFTQKEPFLPVDIINDLNNKTSYVESKNISKNNNKVILILLDGLREDYLLKNEEYKKLVNNSNITADMIRYSIKSNIPTMSLPNWLSIISGSTPEMHGVLNNVLAKESPFDHIFRKCYNKNITTGITGSIMFRDLIESYIFPLKGDGIIHVYKGNTKSYPSAKNADLMRFNILKSAIDMKDFKFFLAHFSDIDVKGHTFGAANDKYNSAISDKIRFVSEIFDRVDNNTFVFVVSDHGQALSGGHGGVDQDLIDIPLIIYKKDSNISSKEFTHPLFRNNSNLSEVTMLDIAPTISAILGIATPKQTLGKFMDDIMKLFDADYYVDYMNDLTIQRRDLLISYAKFYHHELTNNYTIPDSLNLKDFIKIIGNMNENYNKIRDEVYLSKTSFYLFTNIVYSLFCFGVILIIIQKNSVVDIFYCFRKKKNTFYTTANRNSLIASTLTFIFYNAISLIAYLVMYGKYGYNTWDSTVVHTPEAVPMYLLLTLGPAIVVIILITKIIQYQYIYVKDSKRGYCTKFILLFKIDKKYNNLSELYMIRIYTLFFSMVELLFIISFQGVFTLFFPYLVPIITPYNWQIRFQLLTTQLIILPLVLSAVFNVGSIEQTKDPEDINKTANFRYSSLLDSNDHINLLSEQGDY